MKKRKRQNRAGTKKETMPLPTQQPEVDRSTYPHKTHATRGIKNEHGQNAEEKTADSGDVKRAETSAHRMEEHTAASRVNQAHAVRRIAIRSREIFRDGVSVPRHPLGLQIAHALALVEAGELVRMAPKKFAAFDRMARRAKNPSAWINAVESGKVTQ